VLDCVAAIKLWIVSAQAAEACGDKEEAVSHYTAMLSSEKTRETGQHGLARNLLASGDLSGAIEQAESVYADNADQLTDSGQSVLAREKSVEAASDCPEFSPAVALASNLLKVSGESKKAISLIEKAWTKNPHPALSLALQDLIAGEPDKTRAKRIASLIKANPDHKESHMLNAEEKLRLGEGVAALSELAPYLRIGDD